MFSIQFPQEDFPMNLQAELLLTDNYGQIYKIITPSVQIGSSPQCTIILDESGVSDVHAELHLQDNSWLLQDVTGENSISINGEKIQTTYKLTNGDVISIGSAILRVAIQELQSTSSPIQQSDSTPQASSADLSGFRSTGGAYITDAQSETNQAISKKPCRACHQLIHPEAEICPHCGVRQTLPPAPAIKVGTKSRTAAALLAIFLGGFGAHKFYLGQVGVGFLYLVFCWAYIPGIVGLIEGIYYFSLNDQQFAEKYG